MPENKYVYSFSEIDRTSLAGVGGKGANLGELCRIPGIAVPAGFCVTTRAYRDFVSTSKEFAALLEELASIDAGSPEELGAVGKRIRVHLQNLDIPAPIQREISLAWRENGSQHAYAVRSSATAEDLPGASFAGQQDTFLNIKGEQNIIECVRKCWASLFTDRAIIYRQKNGFRHEQVLLAVVVQQMVYPDVSGIMFTADPVTGNRKIISIDAGFGLGEALVSGIVSADLYQIKSGKVVKRQIAEKKQAIYARPGGGTVRVEVSGGKKFTPALTDEQAVRLAGMGRSIEKHFGSPQDIEWCLAGNEIFIVQSRPVTTLYPVPAAAGDKPRLFISIGHAQMMTEAMKPLGISVLRTLVPFGRSGPGAESDLLQEAGGRLYLDITRLLEYPQLRKRLPGLLLNVDEFTGRAVEEYAGREDFLAAVRPGRKPDFTLVKKLFPTAYSVLKNILSHNNNNYPVIDGINRFIAETVEENRVKLQEVSGAERIARIQQILPALMPAIAPRVGQYLAPAIITYKLIEHLSKKWLGDTAQLGSISKSPSGNVTTEMGLALGDVADAVRNYPAVAQYLAQAADETFWEGLKAVPGGADVLPVLANFFAQYGMRGTGEIDITRPRWREAPTQLVPAILSHIRGAGPGQHRRDFLAGKEEAELAAEKLLERLRQTPRGHFKARRMQRLVNVHRSLIGVREHPKFFIVQNLDLIKQAILQEADKLTAAGILRRPEEIFWFTLPEIKEIVEKQRLDRGIITRRREKFQQDQKLTPPRVITGEGEIIIAKQKTCVPPGALAGSPVSAGTVEGRARVVLKLEEAEMEQGDILVAPYTDPAWTPLFPLAAGLVTEVGGLMTHGAVVAREYGIPAVVGVENATCIIQDGQRILVDGTRGFVEILK